MYLDRKDWISLAKAETGHRDGQRFRVALDALRQTAGQVVFPLLSVHYMEMEGTRQARRRFEVAGVMEELSGFVCLPPRSDILTLEIDAALAQLVGTPMRFLHAQRLGWGVLQAWGKRGGLTVQSPDDGDVTASVRATWRGGPAAFDAFSHDADLQVTRSVLRGPADEETESELLARGWDPTVARKIAEDRARAEQELESFLVADPEYRRDRLRDVVSGRYFANDLFDGLRDELVARGIAPPLTDLLGDLTVARRFTDSMPSGDAWISLLTAAHRNPHSRWQPNDIFDFDALSVAIPYCDVVVTDRHACHLANASGLPGRLGTTVVATLDELVSVLENLV